MKSETKELLEQLDDAHDWSEGQCYGGNGLELSSTDTCRICKLERHWFNDRQHGIYDRYTFIDGESGAELSLRQAVKRGCIE